MIDVSVDGLQKEIVQAIKDYTEDVQAAIIKEVNQTSKLVLDDVKANSPVRTGEYRKGWRRSKDGSGGQIKYTIHNKSKGWLTHILEGGYTKRDGKRQPGRPHLSPAYDKHVPAMESRIEQIIKDGG